MTAQELRDLMLVERFADTLAAARLAVVKATPWTPAEQAAHRRVLADAGVIPKYHCLSCLRGEHVEECQGPPCRCRCRVLRSFDGRPDPTAPAPQEAAA